MFIIVVIVCLRTESRSTRRVWTLSLRHVLRCIGSEPAPLLEEAAGGVRAKASTNLHERVLLHRERVAVAERGEPVEGAAYHSVPATNTQTQTHGHKQHDHRRPPSQTQSHASPHRPSIAIVIVDTTTNGPVLRPPPSTPLWDKRRTPHESARPRWGWDRRACTYRLARDCRTASRSWLTDALVAPATPCLRSSTQAAGGEVLQGARKTRHPLYDMRRAVCSADCGCARRTPSAGG